MSNIAIGNSTISNYTNYVTLPDGDNRKNLEKGNNANSTRVHTQEENTNKKVFIVHGHDDAAKETMARFVEKCGFQSIILQEQANSGRTIIEKLEDNTEVVFAIIMYTECDIGRSKRDTEEKGRFRARQNVIFEHGYLTSKLGRKRVCALVKGDVEIPSDLNGLIYIDMDQAGAWKYAIIKEMKQAGIEVDANKVYDNNY